MTAAWIIAFGVVFICGPMLVLWLVRPNASVTVVRRLGLGTVLLVILAMAAQFANVPGMVVAGIFWLAWAVSMALMAQVLRLVVEAASAKRWTAALAAVGSTIPWFGILLARMMSS